MNLNNSGKSLTFSQLFENNDCIEIPIIQRDYAQGRDEVSEVRMQFLRDIFSILSTPDDKLKQPLDLDFVYGSLEGSPEGKFIPLDGQQRLTTLFLLHWYLACRDSKTDEFSKFIKKDGYSRFTYQTRTSSKEFCDALVNHPLDLKDLLPSDQGKENPMSKTIEDCSWFFLSWRRDPTIRSMLAMLDSIHSIFSHSEGFYSKLMQTTKPYITFQFLNLKDYGLSDDLYIKMNARGKPLTAFENFKAKLEQLIAHLLSDEQKTLHNNPVSVKDYFSHKIDTEWSDLFWYYRDLKTNLFDEQIMNFIRLLATVYYPNKKELPENKKINEVLGLLRDRKEDFSFHRYQEHKCFDVSFVNSLIDLLDALCNGDQGIKKYLPNSDYYDEEFLFKEVVEKKERQFYLTYEQYVQFYAYCLFIEKSKGNIDPEPFQDWARVIKNLSVNTQYDDVDDLRKSLNSVKKMLIEAPNGILLYLADAKNVVDGFNQQQILEERIKALLLLKSKEWRSVIINAEKHGYFKGQIGFLLKYSGIADFHLKNSNCDWDANSDADYYEKFNKYFGKACAIFNANGLIKFDEYLWERALLCEGDYLIRLGSGTKCSFLINSHRDISWKRLLQSEDKSPIVKRVLDLIDVKTVNENLQEIISNFKETDWRECFVRFYQTIEYCRDRFILKDWSREIFLLSKKIRSAEYLELRSYFLFKSEIENNMGDFHPFTCHYVSMQGIEDVPHVILKGFLYNDISYFLEIRFSATNGYDLKFSRKNGINTSVEQFSDLNNILCTTLGFHFKDSCYWKNLPLPILTSDVAKDLKLIAAKLATFQQPMGEE